MTTMRSIARLAAMGGLCLLGLAVQAQVPANGPAYIEASVASVETLINASQGKALPRLADPVEGKVLDDVWNETAILGKGPYTGADIPALLGIVQKQARVLQIYSQFSPDGKQPDLARNAATYQDELTRSHAFTLKAIAAAFQAMTDFDAQLKPEDRTEARLQGLKQMRAGLLEIATGAAKALSGPAMKPQNQLLIARAFADNTASIVGGLAPANRQALATGLQAADAALKGDAKKPVADFVKATTATACEGLCRLN